MDGLLNERMKQLLNDPEALSGIMEAASRLFAAGEGERPFSQAQETPPERDGTQSGSSRDGEGDARVGGRPAAEDRGEERTERSGMLAGGGSEPSEADRMRLLDAICPFLSPQRRDAAESMLRILRLLSMAEQSGILEGLTQSRRREG